VQNAIDTPHVHFAVVGDRRNGVERLSLIGTLDRSTVEILEREIDDVSRSDGAIVLDLHNLDAVDIDAVRALDVSAILSSGDGDWAPITFPPLPGQRVNTTRLRFVERQP
jgi:hypothetical protein